jgi:hypothetical protein
MGIDSHALLCFVLCRRDARVALAQIRHRSVGVTIAIDIA